MPARRLPRSRTVALIAAAAGAALAPLAGSVSSASSATSLYAYDLANARSSVPNQAASNSGVALRLEGNRWSDDTGTHFNGNTWNKRSVAWADPTSGATIDVAPSEAVGAAVVFRWTPASGDACPRDSRNVMQIGRFATGQSQFKLQLSKCKGGAVQPQCRVAGSATPAGAAPVTASGSITPWRWYRLECVKAPDASGKATLVVRLTDLGSDSTTEATPSIPATGSISSWKPLSVANKYPMPSYAKNTDQFVGVVRRVAMCAGDDVAAVSGCLADAAPG
jgi:hypothetical protein